MRLSALVLGFSLIAGTVTAQEMPAPHRMPRVPVSRETLAQRHEAEQVSRVLNGPAAIIDGERLKIGESDLRLFGVVPPQLAASFGPQARTALDQLAGGQSLTCQIRDRDRDGRLLATCMTANGSDMALELLKRGLAVTARGSLTGTELAESYLAAEQTAQNQKLGLWSSAPPVAAAQTTQTTIVMPPLVHTETAVALPATNKEEKVTPRTDKAAYDSLATQMAASLAAAPRETIASPNGTNDNMHFFERYQALIAGCLMLVTALSIITAVWAQKRRDKRDETKAVAAALRGELMAARGVCIGRLKTITNEDEDHLATWPRIRSTLYQAYVGRLGFLGAELARQVASIYGQSSDYASLYSPQGAAYDQPKRQALETLVRHIDEILPRLASIEQTGSVPVVAYITQQSRSPYNAARSLPSSAGYKTIASSAAQSKPGAAPETLIAYERVTTQTRTVSSTPVQAASGGIKPTALWETVRGFIQNHRNAIAEPTAPHEPHVSEYAQMIEADMARYPFAETVDSFDLPPHKKRG